MTLSDAAARSASSPLAAAARPSASLRIGAWSAIGAGIAGLAGLLSTLPWPELFGLDAVPNNAIVLDPRLSIVLVGHYVILAAGGILGLVAGVMLSSRLRPPWWGSAASLLVAAGAATMGYAAARRAIDVAVHDGRSTLELSSFVWYGGGLFLLGTLLVTLALRRRASSLFVVLGLSSPVLVAAGTAVFIVLGEDAIPMIWGLTSPPPPDYLLALWFIVLGWSARNGRFQDLASRGGAARGMTD